MSCRSLQFEVQSEVPKKDPKDINLHHQAESKLGSCEFLVSECGSGLATAQPSVPVARVASGSGPCGSSKRWDPETSHLKWSVSMPPSVPLKRWEKGCEVWPNIKKFTYCIRMCICIYIYICLYIYFPNSYVAYVYFCVFIYLWYYIRWLSA